MNFEVKDLLASRDKSEDIVLKKWALQIHDVCDLLEIPASSLRNWQNRYGLLTEAKARGSYRRLYCLQEIVELDTIVRLIKSGLRPERVIAALPHERRLLLRECVMSRDLESIYNELAESIYRKDISHFRAILVGLEYSFALAEFVLEPIFSLCGDLWSKGQLSVIEEHEYTFLLREFLSKALMTQSNQKCMNKRPVLICTPGQDMHEGAALIIKAALRFEGISVRTFGGFLPWEELSVYDRPESCLFFMFPMTYLPEGEVTKALDGLRRISSAWIVGGRASYSLKEYQDTYHKNAIILTGGSASRFSMVVAKGVKHGLWNF